MNRKLENQYTSTKRRIKQAMVDVRRFVKIIAVPAVIFLIVLCLVIIFGLVILLLDFKTLPQMFLIAFWILVAVATICAARLLQETVPNFKTWLEGNSSPRGIHSAHFWRVVVALVEFVIIVGVFTALANISPTPSKLASPNSTSADPFLQPLIAQVNFPHPLIAEVNKGVNLPGYGKQASFVRDSKGKLTLFIRNPAGDLAYIQSSDSGKTWGSATIFDNIPPPGGPGLAAAVDSEDRIHVVWGRAPDPGDAKYGRLDNGTWVMTDTIGTGVFARDIAVDSANHPHVVWSNVDIFHTTYDGKKWIEPEDVGQGLWHPDIQINATNDIFLFTNDGKFYPTPGGSVYEVEYLGKEWKPAVKLSNSPFWSGGAAAAIDSRGDIYVVWIGATSKGGGLDQVFFSRHIDGTWEPPFPIGNVNTSAGSTGQESPSVAFDKNDVLYVFWRGLNNKDRPVIFVRALATENSGFAKDKQGWSPIFELDVPSASDVWWPSVADVRDNNRISGVDVVWSATVNKESVIEYSHVTYP